jgi:hypothetical protein
LLIAEVIGSGSEYRKRSYTNQLKIDRTHKRLSEEEIKDALFGITAFDDDEQLEIRMYLEDIINSITTGDLAQDLK